MTKLKKIVSHLYPFTKTITSKVSGTLEVTWINGKKVLDSENANYSYGSLQRLLEYGLSKIYFDSKSDILLLGLGAGSIVHSLRKKFKHRGTITAIELDPVVIDLARNEFEVATLNDVNIIESDAYEFVQEAHETFHLIIVDLFIDNKVPSQFYTTDFWEHIIKNVKSKGTILFNAGILLEDHSTLELLIKQFEDQIVFNIHKDVQGTNTLVIGRKIS